MIEKLFSEERVLPLAIIYRIFVSIGSIKRIIILLYFDA